LPIFVLSTILAFIGLYIIKQRTLVYGRDELLVAMALGSGLPLAILVVLGQFAAAFGFVFLERPYVGAYVVLSVVPALVLVWYVWRSDVTMREPLELLAVTFALGFLFAGFAAIVNSALQSTFAAVGLAGTVLFFFLVVGPVEETVKWLAVRLHAYRDERFDAVIDGAVYGAMAGLGFATIENALYVSRGYLEAVNAASATPEGVVAAVAGTAAVRAFAGPGHVIYSAFAGYYLGLAKFNKENWGPIVVKGLLIAALVHATYNTLSGVVTGALVSFGVPQTVAVFGFILAFDSVFGYALLRKLNRYRHAFEDEIPEGADGSEVVEARREKND